MTVPTYLSHIVLQLKYNQTCFPVWRFSRLRNSAWDFWGVNFGPGFLGVLLEALGTFWGFDFWPHSIIPIAWNLEYPLGNYTMLFVWVLTKGSFGSMIYYFWSQTKRQHFHLPSWLRPYNNDDDHTRSYIFRIKMKPSLVLSKLLLVMFSATVPIKLP